MLTIWIIAILMLIAQTPMDFSHVPARMVIPEMVLVVQVSAVKINFAFICNV